jgi:membrane-associated phospholipid phosphatase
VGQSILCRVGVGGAVERLLLADAALATYLNARVRASVPFKALTAGAATWLAGVEVVLMGALFVAGRRRSAGRMLAAVALVYAGSEVLGALWRRERPFARLSHVDALVPHSPTRSFPSRHVASGLAMATIGRRAQPRLGLAMSVVAWLLGLSRVASGLHYPSDVLAGALLGGVIGRLLSDVDGPPRYGSRT